MTYIPTTYVNYAYVPCFTRGCVQTQGIIILVVLGAVALISLGAVLEKDWLFILGMAIPFVVLLVIALVAVFGA